LIQKSTRNIGQFLKLLFCRRKTVLC